MAFFNKYPYTDFHELNLDYVLRAIKSVMEAVDSLDDWRLQHETEYEQLKKLYDQIMAGIFPPEIKQAFHTWMQQNALTIVGEMIDIVIFNITDDGYFVAYIPESWDDVIFGTTGLDEIIPGYDYGHLTLSYEGGN